MTSETVFRIILPALLIAFVAHRGYYTRKMTRPDADTLKQRPENPGSLLAGLLVLVGVISIAAYVICPAWTAWASLSLPIWLRILGTGLAISGFILLQWAQNTLGENWSGAPRMMKEQAFVTNGPYRFIRHPIYAAFLLILGSTVFISANWLIGLSWIGGIVIEIASRIRFEESLMVEYFGNEYNTYIKTTGRLLPKLF